jgi:hypothetical protein
VIAVNFEVRQAVYRVTGYGFQPIAIVHSLPQALFVWTLILFTIQHIWMSFAHISLTFLLSVSLLVASMLGLLVASAGM